MLKICKVALCWMAPLPALSGMAQAAPVSGLVQGAGGQPVADAQVVFVSYERDGNQAEVTGRTDAAGRFSIEAPARKAPPGALPDAKIPLGRVSIYAPGFALAGGKLLPDGNIFRLEAPGMVRGSVRDEAGKAVAGVGVRLQNVYLRGERGVDEFGTFISVPPALESKFSVTTDAAGQWTMSDLPTKGAASFLLKDARFVQKRVQATLTAATVEVLPIEARPAAVITGRVVGEDGQPAANIGVSTSSRYAVDGWASAESGADGTYRLEGLPTGAFNIVVRDKTEKRVAVPLENVQAKEGATTQAPDLVVGAGALVEGVVTDAATGAPLNGTQIGNERAGAYFSAGTDEKGRYSLRVPPGQNRVYIMGLPPGYLYPDKGSPSQLAVVEIRKGETKNLDFALDKGLTLAGTAFDAAGRPAKGVSLKLRAATGRDFDDYGRNSAAVDAGGNWNMTGLKPGKWDLVAGGEWEVTAPRQITTPVRAPVKVTLRKLQLAVLSGRVLTPEGQPVAGATVKVQVCVPSGPGSWTCPNEELATDADGRFSIPGVRAENRVTLSVAKAGHKYLSGGLVTQKDATFQISDAVLMPLTGHVEGRVLDAAGAPVAGARVLALNGGPQAQSISDEAGRFAIKALPAGGADLIAAHAKGFAQAHVGAAQAAELTLTPVKATPARDIERGYALLAEIIKNSKGGQPYDAAMFAAIDPDRALQLGATAGSKPSSDVVAAVINKLIEADPRRAAQWVPPHLAQLKPERRFYAASELALAVAGFNHDLAAELNDQVQQDFKEIAQGEKDLFFPLLRMGQLAASLETGQAQDWFLKSITAAMRSPNNNADGSRPGYRANDLVQAAVAGIAPYDLELATKVADDLPAEHKVQAYNNAISELSRTNPARARQMLDKLQALDSSQAGFYFGHAAKSLVESIGKTDPAGALALARKVQDGSERAIALALAARFQPKEEALKLLREAANAAPPGSRGLTTIAALALEVDPTLGAELLALARARVDDEMRKPDEAGSSYQSNAAGLALAQSTIEPALSRWLIEAEWARQLSVPNQGSYNPNLIDLAAAMSAVDVERALEMAQSLAKVSEDMAASARRRAAKYLIDPDAERRAIIFNR